MTRDEQRNACIKAMARAWAKERGYVWDQEEMAPWLKNQTINEMTAAFDALHGLAQVIPPGVYVGDCGLTNPPEEKP